MFHARKLCPIVTLFVVLLALSPLETRAETKLRPVPHLESNSAVVSALDAPDVSPNDPRPAPSTGNYVTVPSDFPAISVTVQANATAPGLVFAATWGIGPVPTYSYLLILNNAGEPVYYQKLQRADMVTDFKMLSDGTLSYFDTARNAYIIMDHAYQELGTVGPGNGANWLDEHELIKLDNGHYLVMIKDIHIVDMSKLVPGGNSQAQVFQEIIREVDMAGNVFFEWPIIDYIPITDSTEPLTANSIDYSHCNAIEVDADGNLLYSCRHLDSIIKIDYVTKAIIWQLGGAGNDFTFKRGAGVSASEPLNFYHQHDIRRLPNGDITLFDNHNDHDLPLSSRVAEYTLDEQTKTATLVKVWRNSPNVYAGFMGDGRLLPNGNMFVGWGGNLTPSLTEFHADGSKAFEVDLNDPLVSYRAFRFDWSGRPTWPPALVLGPSGAGIKLTFSWNGWTGALPVARYRLYGGNSEPPSQLLGEYPKAGFETSAQLDGANANYCFYQVVPVDDQGAGVPSTIALNVARGAASCFQRIMMPLIPR